MSSICKTTHGSIICRYLCEPSRFERCVTRNTNSPKMGRDEWDWEETILRDWSKKKNKEETGQAQNA